MMNKTLRIVADRDIPYLKGVLEPYAQMRYLKGSDITHEDVRDAQVIITRTRTRCDRHLLEGSAVQMIATATIGHDHIDLDYCAQHGIEVATAAGCNARAVLQYVMGALTTLARTDGWNPTEKTLGVVGVGNVGSLIYHYSELFGFRVLGCDPPKKRENPALPYLPLEEMLPQCDIVTLHTPLIETGPDRTRGMASERFFAQMKPGSIFINSSRGPVLEDTALLQAIQQGIVTRSVIDTWNHEPAINRELLQSVTFATPHIAGYSRQGKAAGTADVVEAISRRFSLPLRGWYPSEVDPTRPDETLSWETLGETIPAYFNIERHSNFLKTHPGAFEEWRNHYDYRTEFF